MSNYIVSWCNEGLEAIVDADDIGQALTYAILTNKPKPQSVNQILNMLILRARANTQRHYEIYAISTSEGIIESDIRELFEQCPQQAAELMRERGTKIHSDRVEHSRVLIT